MESIVRHPDAADPRARLRGVVILSFVTLLWGTTFFTIRVLVAGDRPVLPASVLILLRFLLAAAVFTPFVLRQMRDRALWAAGVELGFWIWCGYASQAVGLVSTSSGRSAFITSLHVVFVPAMAAVLGRRVPWVVWAAAALALGGTALLSYDGSPPNAGDFWTLLTAVSYAVYILRLERVAARFGALPLTAVQLWTAAVISAGWVAVERPAVAPVGWQPALAVVYLALVAVALTTWLQVIGQRTVPAPQAALLYTLEPVWAVAFAWLALREGLGVLGWVGAAAIMAGAVMSQWPGQSRPREEPERFPVLRPAEE